MPIIVEVTRIPRVSITTRNVVMGQTITAVPVIHLNASVPGPKGDTGATGSISDDPGDLLALYNLYKQ